MSDSQLNIQLLFTIIICIIVIMLFFQFMNLSINHAFLSIIGRKYHENSKILIRNKVIIRINYYKAS